MTGILNFLSHIGGYAGAGMIMFFIGLILIVVAVVRLGGLRKAERSRAVAEFNQRFVKDTGSRISDVEAGAKRAEIARSLGINNRQ